MTFKEFKEEYKKLTNQVERKEFVEKRLMDLIRQDEKKIIGLGYCGNYHDFITPHTEVASNKTNFFSNMIIDDNNIYEEFMKSINYDIDNLYGEPITIIYIQQFIWNYFGPNAGSKFDRMNIYSTPDMSPLSIKKLKQKNIAACSERSALVHNLLKFMGFTSEIEFGKINQKSLHSYIIFQPENANFKILYDPMNPIVYKDNDENKYAVAVSKIENDEYQDLMDGKEVIFNYDLVKKVYKLSEENKIKEDKRTYSSDVKIYEKNQIESNKK